ncbi:SDR family NAD(P)-dependent oxidoreductase [Falsiroseomonas sp.]|uniref:SDR family NAD(P)-dependent oxidoreductase n=1 Tax=Falsiroseomonas sp. TaxID=2870721 RepID=UPI003F6E47EB
MPGLDGKVILITGAGQGIGRSIAEHLAQAGARVVLGDLAPPALGTLPPDRALAVAMDVTHEAMVKAAVAATLERFGRLDGLVNNAGLYSGILHRGFEQIGAEEWMRVMAVNTLGVHLCCCAAAPALRESRGAIVNISSAVAFKGSAGLAHYAASKGAVVTYTRTIAKELGVDGVRVNSVAPGFTLSDGILGSGRNDLEARKAAAQASRCLPRDQAPEDVVGAVAFLLSDAAAAMTGQTLVVDGGVVLH